MGGIFKACIDLWRAVSCIIWMTVKSAYGNNNFGTTAFRCVEKSLYLSKMKEGNVFSMHTFLDVTNFTHELALELKYFPPP